MWLGGAVPFRDSERVFLGGKFIRISENVGRLQAFLNRTIGMSYALLSELFRGAFLTSSKGYRLDRNDPLKVGP